MKDMLSSTAFIQDNYIQRFRNGLNLNKCKMFKNVFLYWFKSSANYLAAVFIINIITSLIFLFKNES